MLKFIKVQTQSEIEQVAGLAKTIWAEHYTPIIGEAQVEYMLENYQSVPAIHDQIKKGYAYYLINYEDKNAGYFSIQAQPTQKTMFLSKIYVNKAFRGKGLARQAIEFIQALSENIGLKSIWLTVNKKNATSIAAYKKMGFAVEKELVQDIGNGFVMDDYKMLKTL
jgi:ribosomal protein S18 acetylase RimI-like enzyme